MKRKYERVEPIPKAEAESIFGKGNHEEVTVALISMALYYNDWKWVQSKCLLYMKEGGEDLQNTAILCLGHLARLHGKLDLEIIIPILTQLKKNPKLVGQVDDTLSDIDIFIDP